MKLIIDIPDNIYDAIKKAQTIISGQRSGKTLLQILVNSVENGTPLDSVRAEIVKDYEDATMYSCDEELSRFASRVCGILSRIGKPESEE